MSNDVKIILEAVNNTKQAFKELEGQFEKTFGQGEKAAGKAETATGGFSNAWVGLTAKVAVAVGVIAGVTSTIVSFVKEAAEAEEIENRLRFALETTGYSWKYAKGAVDEFANSVQASTRFSDEQARQALTNMMMYTQDFAKAQMGAKLAMDMSIRTGQDFGSTTRYIGMAMNGSVEVLSRFIPELRNIEDVLGKDATAAEKAEYALRILQQKFGGTAQADVNTYAGTVAQLKNAWSDFAESLGRIVLPPLTKVLGVLRDIARAVNEAVAPGEMKRLQDELEQIDKLIELRLKGQMSSTTDIWSQSIYEGMRTNEELTELMNQREYLLEKIQRLNNNLLHERQALAGETKPDVLPGKQDPFLLLYGMTEAEFKDRMSYSKLMGEAWKEFYLDTENLRQEWKGFIDEDQTVQEFVTFINSNGAVITESLKTWTEQIQAFRQEWKGFIDEDRTVQAFVTTPTGTMTKESWDAAQKMESDWTGVIQNIGSAFQSGFFDLFKKGFKDLGEVAQQFLENLVESSFRAISQIMTNLALFGSIAGTYKSGSGLLGIIGGAIGMKEGGIIQGEPVPIYGFQHGGILKTNRPTLFATSETGEEEYIIPKSKMGRGRERQLRIILELDQGLLAQAIPSSDDIIVTVADNIHRGGLIKRTLDKQ